MIQQFSFYSNLDEFSSLNPYINKDVVTFQLTPYYSKMEDKANVSLAGAIDLIKKSNLFLAPLFEAITNSLEAIFIKNYDETISPRIEINFYFTGLLSEAKNLDRIEIIDNGQGFNKESFERFQTLLDKSKGFNNRGSGRLQYIHRFEHVEIKSTFLNEVDNIYYTRGFTSTDQKLVNDPTSNPDLKATDTQTILTLKYLKEKNDKFSFDEMSAQDIQKEIIKKFLLKLYLDKKKEHNSPIISIKFYKNGELIDKAIIDPIEIPTPEKEDVFKVHYSKLNASNIEFGEVDWDLSSR